MGSSPLARTPRSTHQMREFFGSNSASNDKNKIKERLQSPRVRSPPHSTPSKDQLQPKIANPTIQRF